MAVARSNNGSNRRTKAAGLIMALEVAKYDIVKAMREKRKAPTMESVALYALDRVRNANKPAIRRHRKAETEARDKMENIFITDEQDAAYDEYERLRAEADEHARIYLILQAEIDDAIAKFNECKAEVTGADQKVAAARSHFECIETALHELFIDMTPTPEKYRGLTNVTVNDSGYVRVCIGRHDISGACLVFHPDGNRINPLDDFIEQIEFLEMLDARARDARPDTLAAD